MIRRVPVLLLLALLLGSCAAPGGSTDGPGGDRSELQLLLFGGPEEVAAYQRMLDAFEDANPDVHVTLTPTPNQDELLAKLSTGFAGGAPPDVFLINFRRYGQYAAQGAIRPVQPYLDASETLDESDFVATPLEVFRFDGDELTCMPQNVSSLVTYVNLDRFEAAGLEWPVDGWDWDDFLAAAKAMTDADDGVWGLGTSPDLIRVAPFVWSNGGDVVDDPESPSRLVLTEPGPAMQALDFFLDLSLVHQVVPPDADEQSRGARDRFLDGDLGMYLNSRKAVPELRTIEGFEWDVAPLPVAPGGQPVTMLHADAYCIADGTGNEDTAWRLIEFAMSRHGQQLLAESGRTVPSRHDVLASDTFRSPTAPPASAQVYVDNAEIARATPTTAAWLQVERLGDDLLADVFYGRIDREAGLQRLIDETAVIFARDAAQAPEQ